MSAAGRRRVKCRKIISRSGETRARVSPSRVVVWTWFFPDGSSRVASSSSEWWMTASSPNAPAPSQQLRAHYTRCTIVLFLPTPSPCFLFIVKHNMHIHTHTHARTHLRFKWTCARERVFTIRSETFSGFFFNFFGDFYYLLLLLFFFFTFVLMHATDVPGQDKTSGWISTRRRIINLSHTPSFKWPSLCIM